MWDKAFDDYLINSGVIMNKEDKHRANMIDFLKNKYEQGLSLYRDSLLHPELNLAAKIPSEIPQETATACLKYNLTITPNASGNFVVVLDPLIQPININVDSTLNGAGLGTAGWTTTNLSIDSNIIDMWRLVSCSVVAQYTGQLQNLSGYIVGASTSNISAATNDTYLTFSNIEDIQNKRVVSPIDGIKVIYVPADPTALEFCRVTDYTTSPYNTYTRWKHLMIIAGSGLPSTACIRLDIYKNFEYVSKTTVREYIAHQIGTSGSINNGDIKLARDNAVKALSDESEKNDNKKKGRI